MFNGDLKGSVGCKSTKVTICFYDERTLRTLRLCGENIVFT